MRISTLRDRVRSELLDFAWSQWVQLGLAGDVTRIDRWAMDPEALLLFSLEAGRRDPRLFDEVLDWMASNNDLINLQRLKNLARRHPGDRRLVEGALAWVASAAPKVRWSLATPADQGSAPDGDVFPRDLVAFTPEVDPVFARFGYRRPIAQRSRKSGRPSIRQPIAFAFRLRLLFGLGSRAEALRILLTADDEVLDAAQIADEAGFAKRNINEALSAMAESGGVKARWSRNQRVFRVFRDKWAKLLEIGPGAEHLPKALPWVPTFRALTAIHVWLERADPNWSEYLASSEARSLIDPLAGDLEAAGIALPDPEGFPGAEFGEVFEQVIDDAIRSLQAGQG